jgi:hypothetical protein
MDPRAESTSTMDRPESPNSRMSNYIKARNEKDSLQNNLILKKDRIRNNEIKL